MRNILKSPAFPTLIFLMIFLFSCGPKTMDKARNYVEVKMYEEAIPLLEMEVQKHPKNAEAHFLLGKSYLHTGEEEKAEISFTRAIKALPIFKSQVANEYKELGIKLLEEGEFDRAKERFDQAVNFAAETKTEIAEIMINKGKELSESDIDGSLLCFREAIKYSEKHKNNVGNLCLSIAENLLDEEKIDEAQSFADLSKEALGDKFEKEGLNYRKKLSELRGLEPIKISGEVSPPVRAGVEIKPPKLIKKVDPVYPEIARQARVEGAIILEVTTDIYGRVQRVKVLRSIPLLDQSAIDAVRQWVYEPMIIDGRPRGIIFTVTVRFKLNGKKVPPSSRDYEDINLVQSLEIVDVQTKWVSKYYQPWPPKLILVPAISFRVKNLSNKPLHYINFNANFRFKDDYENLGDCFLAAIRGKPVMPGELSELILLKSNYGVEGKSVDSFKGNPRWRTVVVKIFSQLKGSKYVLIGVYEISKKIDFKEQKL